MTSIVIATASGLIIRAAVAHVACGASFLLSSRRSRRVECRVPEVGAKDPRADGFCWRSPALPFGALMARNGYYRSEHWKALRHRALERDGHRCTVDGCTSRMGLTVDHIETRPNADGPTTADRLDNLRTLCGFHDRQIKETKSGQRRNGGRPFVVGYDEHGVPLDPKHHWR